MVGGGITPMPAGNKECYAVSKIHQKPILNASLPAQFRQLRLVLAREPGHPEGDAEVAYVIVAPLDPEDRLDANSGENFAMPAGSCASVGASTTTMVNSFIGRAVVGLSTTRAKPAFPTKWVTISQMNVSSSANMSRSTIRQDAYLSREVGVIHLRAPDPCHR